jgi:hypothetical protein
MAGRSSRWPPGGAATADHPQRTVDVTRPAYTPSVTEKLPTFPWNDGEGEDGWSEGIDLSFDTWKHDEHMPFDDAETVWQELLDRLEEEGVSLTAEQRRTVRPIFDRLWANYKVL